ncbi:trehalose-phosphatase [Derxia gummosa]|uniref:Trehalose 6-phosphate phosphatase n=1 Tax=Derxia gummosa DSM 723 TaxID=1121388 RepID=A0A8B6XA83_9BURK|nr:trehalose-phosphatase [Derxia gummosa]
MWGDPFYTPGLRMDYLFSEAGNAALDALASSRTLFAFDFDGTLAPITSRVADAAMTPDMQAALVALSSRAPVAVISGRSVSDLRSRLPGTVRYAVGNHGNEGLPLPFGALPGVAEFGAICEEWRNQLEIGMDVGVHCPGVEIEFKGIGISLHYRRAPDQIAARECIDQLIDRLWPTPCLIEGHYVVNLLPEHSLTKHDALEAVLSHTGCSHALFIGDDITDEYAFADAPPNWMTIRVGATADSEARWFVNDQSEVLSLIRAIVARRS